MCVGGGGKKMDGSGPRRQGDVRFIKELFKFLLISVFYLLSWIEVSNTYKLQFKKLILILVKCFFFA